MREFTIEELKEYDGRDGISYIAYNGNVYDVSESRRWHTGNHQSMHRAGTDLTGQIKRAPHSADRLKRFPIVGELKPGQ